MSDAGYFTDKAMPWILAREGGLSDDPQDPGGLTNLGISQRAFPDVDIRALTPQTVAPIYFQHYWTPAGCPNLPDGDSLAVFDTAVNIGVARAVAMWDNSGANVLEFLDRRRAYYERLAAEHPQLGKFLSGWLRRVTLIQEALA